MNPIGDLLKSEVRAIARELDIDSSIINAAPTDGLFDDSRTDESQIGASYDELEWAMTYQQNNEHSLNDRQKKVLNIYRQRNEANQHKIQPIPICHIPKEFK